MCRVLQTMKYRFILLMEHTSCGITCQKKNKKNLNSTGLLDNTSYFTLQIVNRPIFRNN